jgi:hypothetical protein
MALSVPASRKRTYAKQAEVTAITASVAAQATSGPSAAALALTLLAKQTELVTELMATGELSPATILANSTWGT